MMQGHDSTVACPTSSSCPDWTAPARGLPISSAQIAPAVDARVIPFPTDEPLGYAELETLVRQALPADRRFVLLAESFSGPLAIRIGADPPRGLAGVILCGTFAKNPYPWLRLMRPLAVRVTRQVPAALAARTAHVGIGKSAARAAARAARHQRRGRAGHSPPHRRSSLGRRNRPPGCDRAADPGLDRGARPASAARRDTSIAPVSYPSRNSRRSTDRTCCCSRVRASAPFRSCGLSGVGIE